MSRRRKRKQSNQPQRRERISPEDALTIVDPDLPDGAYWAMMEELTGMEACDLVRDDDT